MMRPSGGCCMAYPLFVGSPHTESCMTNMHSPQEVHACYYSRSRKGREGGEQYGIRTECVNHTVRLLSFHSFWQRKRLQLVLVTNGIVAQSSGAVKAVSFYQ